MIDEESTHLSVASVCTSPIRWTTFMPLLTRPNIVCLPSRKVVGASVMKNCDPFVFGPLLAIERICEVGNAKKNKSDSKK
jgi:hypothetical protein